jgi:Amt family ammonium transporter
MIFVFVWATLVYDPIAYWVWNPNGWSARLPSLDFAGGTPVHISSGATALALTIKIGPRLGFRSDALRYSPNNVSFVVLGTAMMWFGWFGFNGGSALSANLRASNAVMVTNLAACVGGLTYAFWVRKRFSIVKIFADAQHIRTTGLHPATQCEMGPGQYLFRCCLWPYRYYSSGWLRGST